jgi:hypothetical protein
MDIVPPENSPDDMPLLKRRRVSDCAARSCEASRFASSSLAIRVLKHLWFPEGDIVLDIEQRLLKVHRKRLRCSVIFSDMLQIPQPSPSETDRIDGCPSVTLVGDALADWEVVFGWIYQK